MKRPSLHSGKPDGLSVTESALLKCKMQIGGTKVSNPYKTGSAWGREQGPASRLPTRSLQSEKCRSPRLACSRTIPAHCSPNSGRWQSPNCEWTADDPYVVDGKRNSRQSL